MDDLTDIPNGLESEVYPMTMATQLYTLVCQSIVEESTTTKKEVEPFVVSSDVLKSAFKFLADYQISKSGGGTNGDQKHRFGNNSNGHSLKHRTLTSKSCLTVFSSPYKCRKPKVVSTELPSYVKKMMEKDASLRRLLKTGNVTISHIPHDPRDRLRESNLDGDDDDEDHSNDDDEEDEEDVNFHYKESSPSDLNFGSNLLKRLAKKASATTAAKQKLLSQEGDVFNNEDDKKPMSRFYGKNTTTTTIPSKRKMKQKLNQSVNRQGKSHKFSSTSFSNTRNSNNNNDRTLMSFTHDNSTTILPTTSSSSEHDNEIDPTKFLEVSFREEDGGGGGGNEHRRKYNCPHCLKRFNWSTDLKRHILTHTGERPFKCEFCSANFTRKFLMQKHARKHHQELLNFTQTSTVEQTVTTTATITPTTNGHTNGYNNDDNNVEEEEEEEEEEEQEMTLNEVEEEEDFVQEDFVQEEDFLQENFTQEEEEEDFLQEDFTQEDEEEEEDEDNVDMLESEDVADTITDSDVNPEVYVNNENGDDTEGPIVINVFSSLNEAGTNQDTLHLNGHSSSTSSSNNNMAAPRKLNQSMVKQLANVDMKNYRHNAQRRFISLVQS